MPYAFTLDVPVTPEMYAQVRARLGNATPAGLISHVVIEQEDGLRYIDVWESEDAWVAFRDSSLLPVLTEVHGQHGITPEPARVHREDLTVIDAWVAVPQPAQT